MHYRNKQFGIRYGLKRHLAQVPITLLALTLIAMMASPSTAGLQTFTDLTTWQSAVNAPTVLEDFESADIDADGDDNGGAEDINFAGSAGPITFNDLRFDGNGDFNDNGSIDVGNGAAADGETNGFDGFRAGINGNVVVDMPFLNFTGGNAPEFIELSLPLGTTAVSFVYRNGDNVGDGTILTVDGVTIDGILANHTGPAFDTEDGRYFDPVDVSRIPGVSAATGPGFFGLVNDTGTISTLRFTAAENSLGSAGSTTFNSLDDIRYTEPDLLTIRVDVGTGLIEILNDTSTLFDIDSYRIESSTDDLNFSGWNSLSDQNIDAIDGLDPDAIVGNSIGETWDEAGGADDGVLAESFLLGSSAFETNRIESLGNAFKLGGDTNSLSFQYRTAADGAIFNGQFEFVETATDADFDGDGDVDGADFLTWQRGLNSVGQTDNSNGDANGDGTVNGLDLTAWQGQFGNGSELLSSVNTVPEPSTCCLLLLSLTTAISASRKRRIE